MTKDFADLADSGRRLGEVLRDSAQGDDAVLLAVMPNGVPVALAASAICGCRVIGLPIARSDFGVEVTSVPDVEGRTVLVVDDGVETGTVARAVAGPLRDAGAARVVLAVPVCPREAMADLLRRYDDIVSVVTPMVRRDLAWHFTDFDTIDEDTAATMLAQSS